MKRLYLHVCRSRRCIYNVCSITVSTLLSQLHHAEHHGQHTELYSFFRHAFSWAEVSDHKGGVLLLCAVLLAQAGIRWGGRRAAVTLGGAKRLHSLSEAAGAAALAPWAIYHWGQLVRSNISFT